MIDPGFLILTLALGCALFTAVIIFILLDLNR